MVKYSNWNNKRSMTNILNGFKEGKGLYFIGKWDCYDSRYHNIQSVTGTFSDIFNGFNGLQYDFSQQHS